MRTTGSRQLGGLINIRHERVPELSPNAVQAAPGMGTLRRPISARVLMVESQFFHFSVGKRPTAPLG